MVLPSRVDRRNDIGQGYAALPCDLPQAVPKFGFNGYASSTAVKSHRAFWVFPFELHPIVRM